MDTLNVFSADGGIFYIVSQIFAVLAFVFDMAVVHQKKKTKLLKIDTAAAFSSFLHYVFLGAWAGILSKVITTARNATAAIASDRKWKNQRVLTALFVVLYIAIGMFALDSPFAILPILAPCIYTVVIYFGGVAAIRYAYVATCVMWLVYNAYVMSIAGVITYLVLIVNGILAIYHFRKTPKRIRRDS